MKEMFVFLGVATLGRGVYHIGQKAIPGSTNPMVVWMVVYLVALLLVPVAIFIFRESFSSVRVIGIIVTRSGMALISPKWHLSGSAHEEGVCWVTPGHPGTDAVTRGWSRSAPSGFV